MISSLSKSIIRLITLLWIVGTDLITPINQKKSLEVVVAMTLNEEECGPNFYTDSGAIAHIKSNPGKMSKVVPYKGMKNFWLGMENL